MTIEMYGSDDAGHLVLLPDPSPDPTATMPPAGEPPLPGADGSAPPAGGAPVEAPGDELAALRRLIDEREQAQARDNARRDAQVETVTRVLAGQAPEAPVVAPPPAGPPARPQEHEFETHADFVEAVADWKAEEKVAAYQEKQAQAHKEATQKAEVSAQQEWQRRRDTEMAQAEATFQAQYPDYQERVRGALVGKLAQHVHGALMLFDEAPAIAYTMAQDPALVQRLNAMPPAQLLYALGRLSAAPVAPSAPPVEATPPSAQLPRRLPAPPRPLSGTGVAPVGGYREDMSMPEYRAWRQSQTH